MALTITHAKVNNSSDDGTSEVQPSHWNANHSVVTDSTNTQVQFNDSGAIAGDAGLTYDKTTDTLAVVNQITSNSATVGTSNNTFTSDIFGTRSVAFTAAADTSAVFVVRYAAYGPTAFGVLNAITKTRGASPDAHTILQSGDAIHSIQAYGSDGITFVRACEMEGIVDGTPTSSFIPAAWRFTLRNPNFAANDVRMRLGSTGLDVFSYVSALTSAVDRRLELKHQTLGTPAAGIGVGMQFKVQTTGANEEIGAAIDAITTDVTAASEDFDLVFSTMSAGATAAERWRISSDTLTGTGSLKAHNATAIPAGGTAGAGLLFSSTANFGVFFGSGAPTLSAAQGSIYLRSDGSSSNDRMYVNTNGSSIWTNVVTAA